MFKWKDFIICLLLIVCLTLSVVSALKVEKVQQGAQGIQGERGEQGLQGIQGEKGEKGDTGAQGIQGEKGEQGIQGLRGEKGIQGIQGERGKDGLTPYIGEDGFWWIGDTNTKVLAIQPIYAYPYLKSVTTNEMQTAPPNTIFTNIVLYVHDISSYYSSSFKGYTGYIGGINKLRFYSKNITLENASAATNKEGFVVCDLICHGDNAYTIRNALSLEDYAIQYVN